MKLYFLFLSLIWSVSAYTQTVTQFFKTGKSTIIGDHVCEFLITKEREARLLVPLYPIRDCEEYYIVLDEGDVRRFVRILEKYEKKLKKWQQTATKEHVVSLKKNMGSEIYVGSAMGVHAAFYFAYILNSTLWSVRYDTAETALYGVYPRWYLEIDDSGICRVAIESILSKQTFTDNQQLETRNNYGGSSVTKQTVDIYPAGKLLMDQSEIRWYIETLSAFVSDLKQMKIENKKGNLFK